MKKKYTVEENEFTGPKGNKFKLVSEKGKRPYWLKEQKPPLSLPTEAYQLVYDFLPEFKRIWKARRQSPLWLLNPFLSPFPH